jgi:hypothetical protein
MYNTIAKEMLVELLFFFSFRFSSFSTCSNIIMLTSLGAKKIQECKYLKDFPTFPGQENIYKEEKFKYSYESRDLKAQRKILS